MRKTTSTPKRPKPYSCIFLGQYVREQVDPYIARRWKEQKGQPAPFGDLRRQWSVKHCMRLNPYGSEDCPYSEIECATAFREAVDQSLDHATGSPVGYFRKVATSSAAKRADEKSNRRGLTRGLAHGTTIRTGVPEEGAQKQKGPGQSGPGNEGLPERQGMPSTNSGPISIGDVLRSLDLGPRKGTSPDGQEGSE